MLSLPQLAACALAVVPALAAPMDSTSAKMVQRRQAMASSGLTDIDILNL